MKIDTQIAAERYAVKVVKNQSVDNCIVSQTGDVFINFDEKIVFDSLKKNKQKYFIIK